MTEIIRRKSFTDAGVEYETRVWLEEDGVRIRVFQDDRPVGLTFSVSGTMEHDYRAYGHGDAVAALMEMAEGDVRTHARKPRLDRLPGITLPIDVAPATFFERVVTLAEGSETIGAGFVPAKEAGRNLVNVAQLPHDEEEGLVVQLLEIDADTSRVDVETRSWTFSPRRPSRQEYLEATRRVLDPLLRAYAERFGATLRITLDDA